MSNELKRQLAYATILIGCLVGFAVFKGLPVAPPAFAVGSVAVLVTYVVRSDEVERALGIQAGAAAFALLLAAALILAATGQAAVLASWSADLWAVMVATALVCWVALRIRLG